MLLLLQRAGAGDDEVVAVHHGGARLVAKDACDLGALQARNPYGIGGIIGNKTPCHLVTFGVENGDGVAAREVA